LKAEATSTSTSVRLHGHVELDYDEKQLGWIVRGFVEAARGMGPDPTRMFEPACEPDQERTRNEKLLELGREIFQSLPAAAQYFRIDESEWASWWGKAVSSVAQGTIRTASTSGMPSMAWLPPVIGPVSARFGEPRPEGLHKGIDVAVTVGTPVLAPQNLKVREVGFDERGGNYVVADIMRDDGKFKGDGFRVRFAHLADVLVTEDQVVRRGETLGLSGATGKTTGPHLHFRVDWVDDRVFSDKVVSVDPLGVIPEAVLVGQAVPSAHPGGAAAALQEGRPLNVIVAPGAGRVSIGAGIIQPDTNVRVGSPSVQLQSYYPSQGSDVGDDPLEGIVTEVRENLPGFLRTAGGVAQAAGTVASVGGTVVSALWPQAAPIAAPVATVGGIVAGAAPPLSSVGAAAAEAFGSDPFLGIV
jgi:murein DD-endopeptidase MepM/ murein hydrolase activator NlpD